MLTPAVKVTEDYRSANVDICGFEGYPSCHPGTSALDLFLGAPLPHQVLLVAYVGAVLTLTALVVRKILTHA